MGGVSIETYTCVRCDDEVESAEENLTKDAESINDTGYCLSCIDKGAYCEQHQEYVFESVDVSSVEECNMCKECADERFSGPQSDDPDYWDAYDPDMD